MKKPIPPAVFVVAVVAVIVVAVAIGFGSMAKPNYSKPAPMERKIELPPSQVGTKLGKQVLSNDNAPKAIAPTGK